MKYVGSEGWKIGSPVVRVSNQVIAALGEATVHYDALQHMYSETLGLEPVQVPRTVFKALRRARNEASNNGQKFGRYSFILSTSYVDPIAISAGSPDYDPTIRITETIIDQALLCRGIHDDIKRHIAPRRGVDYEPQEVISGASILEQYGPFITFAGHENQGS